MVHPSKDIKVSHCDLLKKEFCSPGIICCLACHVGQFGKQEQKPGGGEVLGSNLLPGN